VRDSTPPEAGSTPTSFGSTRLPGNTKNTKLQNRRGSESSNHSCTPPGRRESIFRGLNRHRRNRFIYRRPSRTKTQTSARGTCRATGSCLVHRQKGHGRMSLQNTTQSKNWTLSRQPPTVHHAHAVTPTHHPRLRLPTPIQSGYRLAEPHFNVPPKDILLPLRQGRIRSGDGRSRHHQRGYG